MKLLALALLLVIAWDVDLIARTVVQQAHKQVEDDFNGGDEHDRILEAVRGAHRTRTGVTKPVELATQAVLGCCP
jgi:hypothetical protein